MSIQGTGSAVRLPIDVAPGHSVHWTESTRHFNEGEAFRWGGVGMLVLPAAGALLLPRMSPIGWKGGAAIGAAIALGVGTARGSMGYGDDHHPQSHLSRAPVEAPTLPTPKAGRGVRGDGPGRSEFHDPWPKRGFNQMLGAIDVDYVEVPFSLFPNKDRHDVTIEATRSYRGDYVEFTSLDGAMAEAERLSGDQAVYRRNDDRWFVMDVGRDHDGSSGSVAQTLQRLYEARDDRHVDGLYLTGASKQQVVEDWHWARADGTRIASHELGPGSGAHHRVVTARDTFTIEASEIGTTWFAPVGDRLVAARVGS
jgi:hypothetical protein